MLGCSSGWTPTWYTGPGFLERLFDVDPKPAGRTGEVLAEVLDIAAMRALSDADLETRSRDLVVAMRVWKRQGDMDNARALATEYKRVRRDISRRSVIDVTGLVR